MPLIGTIGSTFSNASTTTVNVTVNTTITAGQTLVGAIVVDAPSTTDPTLVISDTHGNTYTVNVQRASNVTVSASIFSCSVTTQINNGDVITIQATSGARSRWAVTVQAFDDILTPALDRTASNAGASATPTSGTTAVTTNANELVYAAFGSGVRTFTPEAGFTASAQVVTTAGTADRALSSEWKYVNSTGAQTAGATLSSSSTYAGVIATYRSQTVANQLPTANAGPDQVVSAQQVVTLDGTGSADSDGTITTYAWQQLSGPTVTLQAADTAQPTFVSPVVSGGTTVTFGLTVTDNAGGSSTQDTVSIAVDAPIGFVATAASGTYQGVSTIPSLDVAVSRNVPAGHTLVGSLVMANSVLPSITITDSQGNTYAVNAQVVFGSTAATYIFSSRISSSLTTTDMITIAVASDHSSRWAVSIEEFDNIKPALADRSATNGALTTTALTSGATSTTIANDEVIFAAFGYGHPSARTFTPGAGFTATTQQVTTGGTFDRALSNEYRIVNAANTYTATGTLSSSSTYSGAIVTYHAYAVSGNQTPIANAGPDQSATVSTVVSLDGTGSGDSDGTIASYAWRQISGTPVTLSSDAVAQPTFTTPAAPSTLVFGLTITDNNGAVSTEDTVTVFVATQLGYLGQVIAGAKHSTSSNYTLTFSKTVSSGHTLLIGVVVDATGASDNAPVFSATDTKGNTYTVDVVTYRPATLGLAIISCNVSLALTTSDTITITSANARNRWAVTGSEFDNITPGGLDRTAANNVNSSTSLATAATGTTLDQYEIIFAVFGFGHNNNQTFTKGAHYTQAGTQQSTVAGSSDRSLAAEYRFFSTAASHIAPATLSAASGYGSVVATYAATSIGNQLPTAHAGSNQTVDAFSAVTLNGTGSSDEDGLVTGYVWTQVSGTSVSLTSPTTAQPTFTAPGADGTSTLEFSLVVTDNNADQSINDASVTITVNSAEAFAAHQDGWEGMPQYAAHADTWS